MAENHRQYLESHFKNFDDLFNGLTDRQISILFQLFKNDLIPEIEKSDYLLYNYIGFYYKFKNDIQQAKLYFLKGIDTGDTYAMINYGDILKNDDDGDLKCIQFYMKAAELNNGLGAYRCADYYQDKNDVVEMEKWYKKAFELGCAKAFTYYGDYLENKNCFESAEKYYLMAIEKGHRRAITFYAMLQLRLGKFDVAESYLTKVIECGNDEEMVFLGISYERRGMTDLAEKWYNDAIAAGVTLGYFCLGRLRQNAGQFEEMEKIYGKGIEKGDHTSLIIYGDYLEINGKFDKLLTLLEKYDRKKLIEFLNKPIQKRSVKLLETILGLNEKELKQTNESIILIREILDQKIDLLDIHFRFSVNGQGFNEAKADFLAKIIKN